MAKPRPPRKKRRRKRTFRFTREGKVFVSVTMGVGLAAVNTGNNLLYLVLGLMLSLLLVSGTLSDLALTRIRARRKPPRRSFVGSNAIVEVALANDKTRFPSYALEVEDLTLDDHAVPQRHCFFLKVGPRDEERATYRQLSKRRGLLTFSGFIVRTRYPFGLIEKGRTLASRDEMIVYPRIVEVDADLLRGLGLGQDAPTRRVGHSGDVHSLRDYVEGDGARSIHWRRSAAFDRLIVRQRHAAAHARVSLILDQAEPEHTDHEARDQWHAALEEAISRAASLADLALRRGAAVDVQVRGASSPLVMPGSPPDPIWRFLALLETVPRADAPALPERGDHTLVVEVAA